MGFKKQLLKDIRVFVGDVMKFRNDFVAMGQANLELIQTQR